MSDPISEATNPRITDCVLSFGAELSAAPTPDQHKRIFDNLKREWRGAFPIADLNIQTQLSVSNNAAEPANLSGHATPPQPCGFVFQALREDGKPKRLMRLVDHILLFECTGLESETVYPEQLRGYWSKAFNVIAEETKVTCMAFYYKKVYLIKQSAQLRTYPFGLIFREGNTYIPVFVKQGAQLWHVHQGRLDEEHNLLERVNLGVAKNPDDLETLVTNVEHELRQELNGKAVTFEEAYQGLSQKNEIFIKELLQETLPKERISS